MRSVLFAAVLLFVGGSASVPCNAQVPSGQPINPSFLPGKLNTKFPSLPLLDNKLLKLPPNLNILTPPRIVGLSEVGAANLTVGSPDGKTFTPGDEVFFMPPDTEVAEPWSLYIRSNSSLVKFTINNPISKFPAKDRSDEPEGRPNRIVGRIDLTREERGTFLLWKLEPRAFYVTIGGTILNGKLTDKGAAKRIVPGFIAPQLPDGAYQVYYQSGKTMGPVASIGIRPRLRAVASTVQDRIGELAPVVLRLVGPINPPVRADIPNATITPVSVMVRLSSNSNPTAASPTLGQAVAVPTNQNGEALFGFDLKQYGSSVARFTGDGIADGVDVTLTTTPAPPPVGGMADFHAHFMAHLAFGGNLIFGLPEGPFSTALGNCLPMHGAGGTGFLGKSGWKTTLATFASGERVLLELGHETEGFPNFKTWPRYTTMFHQQAHVDMIRRAWQSGNLRLVSMLAVNNQLLRDTFQGSTQTDTEAINAQIQGMKELVGRNASWMQIALSPADARTIIGQGKLAVILGVEVDNLGDWIGTSNSMPSPDDIRAEIQRLYDLGVRQITPIHFADNAFGGYAVFGNNWNINHFFLRKDYTQVEPGPKSVNFRLGGPAELFVLSAMVPPPVGVSFAPPPYDQTVQGHVNVNGLLPMGEVVIREMMQRGMIIDIDHMSEKSANKVLDICERQAYRTIANYPVICSHNGLRALGMNRSETSDPHKLSHEGGRTDDQIRRIYNNGGVMALISGQGDVKALNRSLPECAASSASWAQAYRYLMKMVPGKPVAIGTDINMAPGQPAPRFGTFAASGLREDSIRGAMRKAQINAQTNGVKYTTPIQTWEAYQWYGDGATPEEGWVWEALALAGTSQDIDAAPMQLLSIAALGVRTGFTNNWIKDLAKGFRAAMQRADVKTITGQLTTNVMLGAFTAYNDGGKNPKPNPRLTDVTKDTYRKVWAVATQYRRMTDMSGQTEPPLQRFVMGNREYDYNLDGFAHYGMLPDFLQDLRNIGLRNDLGALMSSAEGYIRAWEKAERLKGSIK